MKIALIQLDAQTNKAANVKKAVSFVTRAIEQKAKFILLPETFNFRGKVTKQELQEIAEPVPGESLAPLVKLARQHNVFILAGSIYERAKNSQKVFNTSVLISQRGPIKPSYRKIHLFEAVFGKQKIKESDRFLAGKTPVLARVGPFSVGLSVCYDVRFPGMFRAYSQKGANVLCVPSVFTRTTGQAHWEILLRARAIENLSYVLAPNQVGVSTTGVVSYGNSMIVGPWGEIMARGSADKEEIIFGEIDIAEARQRKRTLPGIYKK